MANARLKRIKEYISTAGSILKLSNCGLSDDNIKEIVELIKNNSIIQSIHLEGNNIGDKGAKAFANLNIQTLNLDNNDIKNEGALVLLNNKAIKRLNLSRNHSINKTICEMLIKNTHHLELGLDLIAMTSELHKALKEKLNENNKAVASKKIEENKEELASEPKSKFPPKDSSSSTLFSKSTTTLNGSSVQKSTSAYARSKGSFTNGIQKKSGKTA